MHGPPWVKKVQGRFITAVAFGLPILYLPVIANFYIWAFLGFALTALALVKGAREYLGGALAK